MKMNRRNQAGFTLVEIMIVVAIIALLAAIAIPNFVRARATSQANACINNLRQIDGAVQQWALENKQAPGASVSYTDVQGYLKNSVICPSGGTTFANSYSISTVTNKPSCRIGAAFTPTQHKLPDDTTG
jgi:prepilin-type N-terminal cleavage/methylation domain-containing protein